MKTAFELFVSFLKIGALMFGSGYTMLPLLSHEVVERRAWITEDELMDAYALSQCVPGVIAVNTAAFVGQKRGGWGGAAAAVLGVITAPILAICSWQPCSCSSGIAPRWSTYSTASAWRLRR